MQRCTIFISFLTVVGLLILVAGLTTHWIAPSLINSQISEAIVLQNGSQTYNAWLDPPAPVFIEFYLFNLTNSEDVLTKNAKPKLQQIGPYTYKELRVKSDIEFSEDGVYLDYRLKKYFVFDRENSVGSESDWFIGLNIPMLAVANMLQYKLNWGQQLGLNLFLTMNGVNLFNNYSVGEYMWGYTDPFFARTKEWLLKLGQDETAAQIPDQYGLFVGDKANGSSDGIWRIHTGKGDVSQYNKIISWNGNNSVPYWNNEWANMINGTDASMWHPFVKKEDELFMFASDVCRSGSVVFKEEVEHKGLNLYRFSLSPNLLGGADEFPENEAFCTPPGNCPKGGVLNISVCNQGAPILLSQPHFTGAHPDYQNAVEGMSPSPDLQTKLDVDPMTGAVLHAVKHLQFNAYISPLETFPDTMEMNATVYPIMWVNETGGITDEGAYMFKKKVYGPVTYINIASYALMGFGALILIASLALLACRAIKKENVKPEKKIYDPASSVSLMKGNTDVEQQRPYHDKPGNGYVSTVEGSMASLKNPAV